MTLPSRPAPAPPGSRAQNAALTANASLDRLRLQLQQQQQLQRQNVTVPKLTIKLPPPPKGPHPTTAHNGFGTNNNTNAAAVAGTGGSITRKFPQARYAPATNWDDSPFDALTGGVSNDTSASNTNGNYKKPPPPRPPPPKVQPKKPSAPSATVHSSSILSNIFHRKKSSRVPTPTSASRVYGAATYGTTTTTTITSTSSSMTSTSQMSIFNQTTWNNAWNTTPNFASAQTTQSTAATDGQLISFDSPPSSPTFTQKSNSDCLSVDSFSSDSNFSSPNNGSVSQPESGFEDDFSATARTRPATTSPIDPWETLDSFGQTDTTTARYGIIGTAPVRNLNVLNTRLPNNTTGDNPLCNGKSLLPPAPTLNMPTIIKPKISQKPKAPRPPNLTHPNGATLYSDNLCTPPSPPMPQCAPPPPPPPTQSVAGSLGFTHAAVPSLLDVISGKVDALHLCPGGGDEPVEQPYGIALYDFNSTEDGDLCFRENEKIYLLEQVSEEWYKGRTRSGCEGIFPVNYIEIKVPLNNQQTTSSTQSPPSGSLFASSATSTYQTNRISSNSSNNSSKNSSSNSTAYKLQVKSLYNFPAEIQGDLELKENDLVTILYRINEDWLYGEINGLQGQFPANFLEYVPSNIPMP